MHVFLQVVISMVGLYIIFSIINSALVEAYAQYFNMRGKFLKKSLDNFFEDPVDSSINLASDIYEHALVKAFKKNKTHLPAYIDKKIFSQVLMDLVFTKSDEDQQIFTGEISTDHSDKIPEGLKSSLSFIINKTKVADQINMTGIQNEIEELYEAYMTRVSEWYKKNIQMFLMIGGFLLALILNLDSINFYENLFKDSELRKEQVQVSQALNDNREAIELKAKTLSTKISTLPMNDLELKTEVTGLISEILDQENATTLTDNFNDLNIGIHQFHKGKKNALDIILGLVGILLTAYALSFGASFWFDLLRNLFRK